MRITSLLENTTTNEQFKVEHGLSLFIETESYKILFDMGQSDLFAENAKTLGIDLKEVDIAVLSHGHYDHGGGLAKFLTLNDHAPVYVSAKAFERHYNGSEKYIGLDPALQGNARLQVINEEACEASSDVPGKGVAIVSGLTLYTCNHLVRKYNLGSFGLTMVREDDRQKEACENREQKQELLPDDFTHEQYLLIEEKGKRVLISGCSHKGIMDIVEWFEPDVLVGGFHFSKLPLDETLAGYAMQLAQHNTMFYTCHCTGKEQYEYMKKYMPRLEYLSCGHSIEI